ncbi:hypothetical protein BGAL_0341g00060 [Botrytis galanthina]|uniref:Heterokaryon incompatibility domain-containing protein n=1 Tax=Botrytis galanthina TaxID=278940 RepID=A0A4S8QU49_9HELO|nr:hypothetical protein BGAL_0341g00060 [Botrytis galanthina]
MFCETCLVLLRTIRKASTGIESTLEDPSQIEGSFKHHATYDALQKALAIGCILCKKLWAKLRDEALVLDDDKIAAFRLDCKWFVDAKPMAILYILIDYESEFFFLCCLKPVSPSKVVSDRLLLPGYHETTNTGSDACSALAKHWLETCLSSHRSCERSRPLALKQWTPDRLICVKDVDSIVLCLHEMGNIPLGVKYATLSHCWGKIPDAQRLLLMRDNIDSWTRGIPNLQSMKTFHHAITVCQKLGLEYIWINSLCIIQDSQDDWHQQASLMGRVYKYSQCTITATAAENDTVGCFFNRDVNTCLPIRVGLVQNSIHFPDSTKDHTSDSNSNPKSEDFGSMDLTSLYDFHEGDTWEDIVNSPAWNRSWIFQERFLSPRVLHISNRQLFWECTELQASESHPFGLPDNDHQRLHFKTRSPFHYQGQHPIDINCETNTLLSDRQRLDNAFDIWKEVVHTYSLGKLTKGSDKLVAISAVARELQPLMRSRYLAGLWQVDLVPQLEWRCRSGGLSSTVYRAPSWSWASIDGMITFAESVSPDSYYPLVEILEAVTCLVGEDEFGQVQGGHLKLLGQTIDLEILLDLAEREEIILVNGQPTNFPLLKDDKSMGTRISTKKLCCLPLYLNLGEESGFSNLVLECVDITKNVYRRVRTMSYLYFNVEEIVKVSLKDPLISTIGNIEQTKDGSLAFKRGSADLREIVIV